MKGQGRASAVAAVALKPLCKNSPGVELGSSREAAGAGALAVVLGMPLRQLFLSGRRATSEQGFSACLRISSH